MSQAATTQLYGLGIMALAIGFGIVRRMRPQPVRPDRMVLSGVMIALLLGVSLVATGGGIISDPVALVLIPVFVAAGVALGYYLVRTMKFWSDPSTGALWMKGGALFALILVATIAIRLGVRGFVYGSVLGSPTVGAQSPHGLLYDLSADLLFLSLGLWGSRAYFVYRRHRMHLASEPQASTAR
ncbi:MAG TPA: hypothetical protein VIC57_20285 [Candidatus Dormibacteraeota bacterium]